MPVRSTIPTPAHPARSFIPSHAHSRARAAALLAACGLAASLAHAQSSTFTGQGSDPTNWCLGNNWDPSGIPDDGFTIQIPDGVNVDTFQCPSAGVRTLGVITAESPVRFWGPVNFSAGGSLTTPDFSFSTTPNPIGGELVVTGFGSRWHGGIFTAGTLRNTGHLLVRRTTFGGRQFPRAMGEGAILQNDGTMDADVSFNIEITSRLINNVALTFTGLGVTVGGTGAVENPGQLFVDLNASATINPSFTSTGRISSAGSLILASDAQSIRGQADVFSGGSIVVRPFHDDALPQVGPLTLSGEGSFVLDRGHPLLFGQITSSIQPGATGRGFWFSSVGGDITIDGQVLITSGVSTWSAGDIFGDDPARPQPHIVISQGARFAIESAPSENGGYLHSARLDARGIVRQKRTLQLAEGALAVVQGTAAAWELDNALLFGDGTGALAIAAGATLAVNQSETSTLARIDGLLVRMSENSFLDVIRGTLNTQNNTPGNPAFLFAGSASADVAAAATWRMFGRTIADGPHVQFNGSGTAILESGAQLQVADGATLTTNLLGSGKFRQVGILGAGPDDPAVSGFNANFENTGSWEMAGGEISLPRGELGPSVFNLGFFNVTGSGCVLRTDLQNDATMTVTGTLSLRAPDIELINGDQLNLVNGRIASSVEGPGATLLNSPGASISQSGASSAFIDVTLSNHGLVGVPNGTLFCNGAVVQISNSTLTGGTWTVSPGATLRTPNRTITTIGPGASLTLQGSWPEFQPAINQGELRISGLRTIPRAITNSGILDVDIGSTINLTGAGSNYTQTAGRTRLHSGATIRAATPSTLDIAGGYLTGIGTVAGFALNILGGVLAPGESPGVMTIEADLTVGPTGTLEMEIAGLSGPGSPTGHDQLIVTNAASLAGHLRVQLLDGFTPAIGDSFTILTASSITGTFDTITPPDGLPPALTMHTRIDPASITLTFGCPADFNADGFLNPDDLADFITCFFLDIQFPGFCPAADFNADTSRDPDDLADFITAFFLAVQFGC